jgi:D-alanyl-D-alanine carboxypeptidase
LITRPPATVPAIVLALSALIIATPRSIARADSTASAQGESRIERIKSLAQARLDELHKNAEFPGATVGFVLPDGSYAAVSTGYADLEARTPLKPSDRMLAGSIGKTFVSAVMLLLVQEGKVDLETKIESWFGREPWFDRLPNAHDITLRMLMNHSSGIPEHVLAKGFLKAIKDEPYRVWKPSELVGYVLDSKPLFPAGKGFSYADTNYILVGMIFERLTGKTVYGEVARRLLRPLKLDRTIPSNTPVLPEVIPGYSMPNSPFGFEGRNIIGGRFVFDPQMEWCGGGFASTAQDLARWARALYGGEVLKPQAMRQLLDGIDAKEGRGGGSGNKYGLAVQIRQSEWGVSYGHGGWFPGYLSEMEYFPAYKVAVAVQFNTDAGRKLRRSPQSYVAEIMKLIVDEGALEKVA